MILLLLVHQLLFLVDLVDNHIQGGNDLLDGTSDEDDSFVGHWEGF